MNLAPTVLHFGETFGSLRVLEKLPHGRYRVGRKCGRSNISFRAKALMSGRVKACKRCAADLSCKYSS